MKRNFNVALQTLEGEPVIDEGKQVQLKAVAINALLATYQDEQNLDGNEKLRRYKLAQAISAANGGDADLSLEDATLLKNLIGKGFPPLVVGQVFALLEGD